MDQPQLIQLIMRAVQAQSVTPRARRAAQSRFAPQLSYGRHFGPPPHHARNAAVLVALFERDGEWATTLTRRPATLKSHGGQICFPGGGIDSGESHWQCAQREWNEELGGHKPAWQHAGALSDIYVFASNHVIRPCVAITMAPEYAPNPDEVDEVLETPLSAFYDDRLQSTREIERWGTRFQSPCYAWQGEAIWGATAVIIAELALRLDGLSAELFGKSG